jgi:hypothetical protein
MPSLAQQLGKFEPLLSHEFRLFFDEVGGSPLQGREQCEIAVVTAAIPTESSEEIEIPAGNTVLYYAGRYKPESMAVTCRDYVDASVFAFLKSWRRKVHDESTGISGFKREYSGTARLQQYDPTGKVIREYKLIDIWPQQLNGGSADQSSNDPVQIEVTFRYDKAVSTVF